MNDHMTRALAAGALFLALGATAHAGRVRHVYRTAPTLVGLPTVAFDERYQNAADVVLEQAIRNLPLYPGASSAYTWRWNAERGALERVDDMVSPWFVTERGQTLGEGLLNVGLTFGYYRVRDADGEPLGLDPVPLSVGGAPIKYRALTDLRYTASTFNITYGVRDDLDVNIAIPIVTLDMDLDVSGRLQQCCHARSASTQTEAANLSDILVRAKYRFFEGGWEGGPAAAAVGVRARLPTGDPSRGLGTGYGEIGPFLALSTGFIDGWLDSHLDLGVDAGIGDLRRSSAHYGWALDLHAPRGQEWWTRLALTFEILGRSEFAALRERTSVSGPHVTSAGVADLPYLGFPPQRRDYADAVLGVRINLVESIVLSTGVFRALNASGVRPSDWSPVVSVEGTF